MKTKIYFEYLKWADNQIFELILQLKEEEQTKEFNENTSIHLKLVHLAEEYFVWLAEITGIDWKQSVDTIEMKNSTLLIEFIREYHEKLPNHFLNETKVMYEIDEGGDIGTVQITPQELQFNLINHSSYHRGQIAMLLRMLDVKVPITDFYWYKIHHR